MDAQKLTGDVLPGDVFHFQGIGAVRNLFEMAEALKNSSSEDFAHHVNPKKNDVANWISDIFEQPDLAAEIRSMLDRRAIVNAIENRLVGARHEVEESVKATVEEKEGGVVKRLANLTSHIRHLEVMLAHMTKPRPVKGNTVSAIDAQELLHTSFKQGIAEFGFGMVIGIFMGLLIAKVMGLY